MKMIDDSLESLSSPAEMATEELASVVINGFKRIKDYLPYIAELKSRFDKAPRGAGNRLLNPIADCYTWSQFCEEHLGRSRKTIFDALRSKPEPREEIDLFTRFSDALQKFDTKTILGAYDLIPRVESGDAPPDALETIISNLTKIEDTVFSVRQDLLAAKRSHRVSERERMADSPIEVAA